MEPPAIAAGGAFVLQSVCSFVCLLDQIDLSVFRYDSLDFYHSSAIDAHPEAAQDERCQGRCAMRKVLQSSAGTFMAQLQGSNYGFLV